MKLAFLVLAMLCMFVAVAQPNNRLSLRASKVFVGHEGFYDEDHPSFLAFSKSAQILASVGRGGGDVIIYQNQVAQHLPVAQGQPFGLAISDDGLWLAKIGQNGSQLEYWNTNDKKLRIIQLDQQPAHTIVFRPNSSIVALGSNSSVRLWDLATANQLAGFDDCPTNTLPDFADPVYFLEFSRNGQYLSTIGTNCFAVWNLASLKLSLYEKVNQTLEIAIDTNSSRVAVAFRNLELRIYDLKSQKFVRLPYVASHVLWSDSGRQLAISIANQTIQVVNAKTFKPVVLVDGYFAVYFDEKKNTLLTTWDQMIEWDLTTGLELRTSKGLPIRRENTGFSMRQLVFCESNYRESSSTCTDLRTFKQLTKVFRQNMTEGLLHPTQNILSLGNRKGQMQLLNTNTLQPIALPIQSDPKLEAAPFWYPLAGSAVSWLSDNRLLFWNNLDYYRSNSSLQLVHLGTGRIEPVLRFNTDSRDNYWIRSLAVSRDEAVIAGGYWAGGQIYLYDLKTKKRLRQLKGHNLAILDLAFSPDGTMLASASGDGTVRLWDAQNGSELGVLRGHQKWVRSIAFSTDGKQLASASGDGTVRIWNLETMQQVHLLEGHDNASTVAWSGRFLVSGSAEGDLRVWDSQTAELLEQTQVSQATIVRLEFSADGKTLAVSTRGENTIHIYDFFGAER